MLRRDGSFWHEGVRVTHPRLAAAFLRGVRWAEEEGVWVVQLGRFRGQIEVEDTPFWVVAYDAERGRVELTDRSSEPLDPATLEVDPDGAFRCRVRGRFPARFTQTGQAHLLEHVELRCAAPVLRIGDRWIPAPGLAGPA